MGSTRVLLLAPSWHWCSREFLRSCLSGQELAPSEELVCGPRSENEHVSASTTNQKPPTVKMCR